MNVWSIKYPISIIRKLKTKFFRSSRSEVFCKDGVLKIFVKFIEKHLRSILFLTKLQVSTGFSCGFAKFLRTLFLRSSFGDCFGKFFHGLAKFFLVRSHSLSKKKTNFWHSLFVNMQPYILVHTLPLSLYMHTQNDLLWKNKKNNYTSIFYLYLKGARLIRLDLTHTTLVNNVLYIY